MGRTACTEPPSLYKGALYFYLPEIKRPEHEAVYVYLIPRLRMSGVISPLTLHAFKACAGTYLYLTLYKTQTTAMFRRTMFYWTNPVSYFYTLYFKSYFNIILSVTHHCSLFPSEYVV